VPLPCPAPLLFPTSLSLPLFLSLLLPSLKNTEGKSVLSLCVPLSPSLLLPLKNTEGKSILSLSLSLPPSLYSSLSLRRKHIKEA
jgi:hypothetical protein